MKPTQENFPGIVHELARFAPASRGELLRAVVSFSPQPSLEQEFEIGRLRASFADYWENLVRTTVPIRSLREILSPPVPAKTLLKFCQLNWTQENFQILTALAELVDHLNREILACSAPHQNNLFELENESETSAEYKRPPFTGLTVTNLEDLVSGEYRFSTIYADPPWPYDNQASRGAAANHYQTMSLNDICKLPVNELCCDTAHLHLWTTNAFLNEAFAVINAWGFDYKSCLIWIKDELGMGNYWRVSHEYLLLGVRGNLGFRSNCEPSWIKASRTVHSRKPSAVRSLIEKVSPAPYLELFGRESLPGSFWTVFGNQVEPRLF